MHLFPLGLHFFARDPLALPCAFDYEATLRSENATFVDVQEMVHISAIQRPAVELYVAVNFFHALVERIFPKNVAMPMCEVYVVRDRDHWVPRRTANHKGPPTSAKYNPLGKDVDFHT